MEELSLIKQALRAVMNGQPLALRDPHRPTASGARRWLAERSQRLYPTQRRLSPVLSVNPLGCDHRNKCWGHWQSIDLVHWEHQPLASTGRLLRQPRLLLRLGGGGGSKVALTGNVKFPDGSRTAYQCGSGKRSGASRKLGPVLRCRRATAARTRPKVWRHQDAVHGARRAACRDRGRCCCCAPQSARLASAGRIAGSGLSWSQESATCGSAGSVLAGRRRRDLRCPRAGASRNATQPVIRPAICSASWIIGRRPSATAFRAGRRLRSSAPDDAGRRWRLLLAGWACPASR